MIDVKEIQERFNLLSVLVCGDMCLDKNYIGGYSGYSRELEHLPIFRTKEERYNPGGGGNLSVCFSALGVKSIAVGVWGSDDDFNKYILEHEFHKRNVDTSGMVVGSRTPTYGKVYLQNGAHIYRLDLTSERIPESAMIQLANKVENLIPKVDFIACADYEEANEYGVCSENVLEIVTKSPLPKFGTSRKRINRFRGFNYLLLNTKELSEQSRLGDSAELPVMVEDFLTMLGFDEMVVTMGGKGAKTFQRNSCDSAGFKVISVSSVELTENIDPCGCGDMFFATYSTSVMTGYDTETSLKLANAAARVVARKLFGTGQATPEEIVREYEVLYAG